eukprot:scaffold592531_cov138-Attheya_sp.AAC.1
MIRNWYRFNLEGWSLSRVAMVIFGSRSMVGATFNMIFFAQEQANFCVKNKALTMGLFGVRGTSYSDYNIPCVRLRSLFNTAYVRGAGLGYGTRVLDDSLRKS